MKKISCQLSFYPDFLIEHTNFSMDKWYSDNILDRSEQLRIIHNFMKETYGDYLEEDANYTYPHMVSPFTSIQLFLKLFGADLVYSKNGFADTKCTPLADVESIEDLDRHESYFKNSVENWISDVKKQIEGFSVEQLDFPLHLQEIDMVKDLEMIHCPLTVGYKLFGDNILYMQYDDEELAKECFSRVAKWSVWLMEKIRTDLMGRFDRPKNLLLSACSACFVDPQYWNDILNPIIEDIAENRDVFFHSCGTINNHLDTFKNLSEKINFLKLDCRESSAADIGKISTMFGETEISYMFSPALCIGATEDDIRSAVDKAIVDTGDKPLHLILMLPGEAKKELGTAFLSQAKKHGASLFPINKFRFV